MNHNTRVIVILGMHRSGTSCLTGTLQEAGVYLGPVHTENPYNRKGNREHPQIMALHEDILAYSGGSWHTPPAVCRWTAQHSARRDALIAELGRQPLWGFKDPRSLITLTFWRQALPQLERVGIFRHPLAVAASLQARQPDMSRQQGLALWADYNHRLLSEHRRQDFPLIEFVSAQDSLTQSLRLVRQRLALPQADHPLRFFEPQLQQHSGDHDHDRAPLPPAYATLYRELQGRAL